MVGNNILVKAGEIVPVDGVVTSDRAMIDEAALSGELIPVACQSGELARSVHSVSEKHSKFGLSPRRVKACISVSSEWSRLHGRQKRPSSGWRTDGVPSAMAGTQQKARVREITRAESSCLTIKRHQL